MLNFPKANNNQLNLSNYITTILQMQEKIAIMHTCPVTVDLQRANEHNAVLAYNNRHLLSQNSCDLSIL